ncbi:DUF3900 domain-containing protein [Paenibacillus cymbidii]|uniref:DUF3900 domain-containing protein n=1 Tax=Paenibacillus cymbidii TaxID=1639034 RepID=UPI0010812A46|nr:DUF3900 domain-containing protein [Paenibacillus cymbidii]
MDFTIQYLSFFVIPTEEREPETAKRYKHYQTLDRDDYEESEIKSFLDGEFARIGKRKAELNAASENAPTKIGRFMAEPGQELASNPNYNLFQRLRTAHGKESFQEAGDELARMYVDTSAVRGGALIVASAMLTRYFDEPFVFVLKCDFESKIARVSDERSLISRVEMAISARNIKSIQYPNMPEEGMRDEWELKIHQASHARYFEDFLRYVSYEKSMPEIVSERVLGMVQQYVAESGGEAAAWPPIQAPAAQDASPVPVSAPYNGPADEEIGAASHSGYSEWSETTGSQADDGYINNGQPPLYAQSAAPSLPGNARGPADERLERWAYSDKRGLQEEWTHERVAEATAQLVELQPELELKLKLDHVVVRGKMADYGDRVHLARIGDQYAVVIVGDAFQFDKGVSPVELLQPEELEQVAGRIRSLAKRRREDSF